VSDERNPVDRAVEFAIHVPIGIAAFARDSLPTFTQMFAGRGKREVAQHQQQVQAKLANYRAIGELAITYGPPVVRQRLAEQMETLRLAARTTFDALPIPRPAPEPTVARAATASRPPASDAAPAAAPTPVSAAVDASSLAIPDYDGLAASQIIERLEGLDPAELDEVDRYERATRARRTVLGKIAVLRAS
jgi:hypothetical protein